MNCIDKDCSSQLCNIDMQAPRNEMKRITCELKKFEVLNLRPFCLLQEQRRDLASPSPNAVALNPSEADVASMHTFVSMQVLEDLDVSWLRESPHSD